MSDDIRLCVGFLDHPKTLKLARRLGDKGIFSLIRLWFYAARERTKGRLTGMDAEDIATVARWDGDAEGFIADLVELRWLGREADGTFALHNWEKRQHWIFGAEERSEAARKAVQHRWDKETRKTKDSKMPKKKEDNGRIRRVHGTNTARIRNEYESHTPYPSFPFPSSPQDQEQHPEGSSGNAEKIVAYYEEIVKKDRPTGPEARNNVLALLAKGINPRLLWKCVELYADEAEEKKPRFRKTANTFFGRGEVYKAYAEEARQIVDREYNPPADGAQARP